MPLKTQQLQLLLNNLASINLDDFKKEALPLVQSGADLSVRGRSAPYGTVLHHLVLTNKDGANDEAITELLKLKPEHVDVKDGYDDSPLKSLINQFQDNKINLEGFKRTAMLLARGGANLSVRGRSAPYRTVLHHLVLTNKDGSNDKALTELLKLKPEHVHVKDGYGHLPLQALLLNQPEISASTFEQAIKIVGEEALHYESLDKVTLLHTACSIGNLDVAQYLVSKGLDLAAKTEQGDTLLHVSAKHHKNQAIWQWLYENKIDINAQNSSKQTALHLAFQLDNQEMVQWLVEHNADRYIRDIEGHTASALAKSFKLASSSSLLKSETPQNKLFASIEAIKDYGYYLSNQGAPKGQVAIDLADALYKKASSFFSQDAATTNFPKFKQEFSSLLKSKNHEMSEYRTSWSTIIANVLFALTGVGLLLMAGKLLHSGITEGRPLFLFQKPRTTCEEKLGEVEAVLDEVDVTNRNITY